MTAATTRGGAIGIQHHGSKSGTDDAERVCAPSRLIAIDVSVLSVDVQGLTAIHAILILNDRICVDACRKLPT